jgi:hypothetical protein
MEVKACRVNLLAKLGSVLRFLGRVLRGLAVVEVWRGRIQVESQDKVVIGRGDDTDGMGVFRYGDREGRVDEGSIVAAQYFKGLAARYSTILAIIALSIGLSVISFFVMLYLQITTVESMCINFG